MKKYLSPFIALVCALSLSPSFVSAAGCSLPTKQPYKVKNEPTIYYVTDKCTKKVFKDPQVFTSYFGWDQVKIVQKTLLNKIPSDQISFMAFGPRYEPGNGALIKSPESPKVYILLQGKIHPIRDQFAFTDLGFPSTAIEDVSSELIAKYIVGEEFTSSYSYPNYIAFKYPNSTKVYILTPDPKYPDSKYYQVARHVQNEQVLKDLNYRLDRIITVKNTKSFVEELPLKTSADLKKHTTILDTKPESDPYEKKKQRLTGKVIRDAESGLVFDNPKNWVVEKIDDSYNDSILIEYIFSVNGSDFGADEPKDTDKALFLVASTDKTLDEALKEVEGIFSLLQGKKDESGPKFIAPQKTTFLGEKGYTFALEDLKLGGTSSSPKYDIQLVFTVKDGYQYVFAYPTNGVYAADQKAYKQILSSIESSGKLKNLYKLKKPLDTFGYFTNEERVFNLAKITNDDFNFTFKNKYKWTLDIGRQHSSGRNYGRNYSYTFRPFITPECPSNFSVKDECESEFYVVNIEVSPSFGMFNKGVATPLADLVKSHKDQVSYKYFDKVKVEKEKLTTVGGKKAMKFYSTIDDAFLGGVTQARRLDVIMIYKETEYVFTYIAKKDIFETHLPQVEEMIQSFRFY